MSAFQHMYVWLAEQVPGTQVRLPWKIREELASAVLLLGVSHTNIRCPISNVLSCTDATPESLGGAEVIVSTPLALELQRHVEVRGEHVRLDGGENVSSSMQPANAEACELMHHLPWAETRSRKLLSARVNIQEM